MPLRLLIATRAFAPPIGGLDQFVERLSEWMASQGVDVTIVCGSPPDPEADARRPFRVVRLPSRRVLEQEVRRADVVHLQGPSLRTMLVGRQLDTPLVVTHHDHAPICPLRLAWSPTGTCSASGTSPGPCRYCPERSAAGWAQVRAHRLSFRLAAVNVSVSGFLARHLGLPRTRVVPNPVAPSFFEQRAPGPGEPGLVGFAGRLVPEKGVDVLIRAIAPLTSLRLEVAGHGSEPARLRQLAADLGIEDRVVFTGGQTPEGILDLCRRAAIMVVPSLWQEPLGYAAAEPMAMERPVIALPVGGLTELLTDGRGFLAPEPTVDALRDTVAEAIADPEERGQRARRAAEFASSELAPVVAGQRYLSIYESCMSEA